MNVIPVGDMFAHTLGAEGTRLLWKEIFRAEGGMGDVGVLPPPLPEKVIVNGAPAALGESLRVVLCGETAL